MSKYTPTIGLEIHAELKTQTKMFCDCLNDPNEKHPNINVCPICLAHPGTLPVVNKAAVEAVLKVGMALNGDIPASSKFDRKNYFYPDLPKGYQISQYDLPLVFGGILKGVKLRRVHLEEDTGRLLHESRIMNHESKNQDSSYKTQDSSLVDFNRAGVPLMELVTEPDIKTSEQAVGFAKELRLILRYLGVSDADMEKGQMRVEANVSLGTIDDDGELQMGTKVEVKNINSFKAVEGAIEYELKRQEGLLNEGKKVIQETRGWDDVNLKTVSQRIKEEAHDYRYFPEPDLPPMDLSKFDLTAIKRSIPELPQEKRARFIKEFNLKPEQAEILIADREAANFFEETVSELETEDKNNLEKETQLIINYLTSDLRGLMTENGIGFPELKVDPENFADLIELISHGKVTSRTAKDILKKMFEKGGDPREFLKTEGLEQVSDEGELTVLAQKIIQANPAAVTDYQKGKMNALQFLVGKAMAELKGKGNPGALQKIFKEILS
ncbi:MAG TPA: Asp-tRNA(Asn)/Glu-tRNA(Gln) amidotransferase subunit GatB [Candidatus Paceibacterota bacterium]